MKRIIAVIILSVMMLSLFSCSHDLATPKGESEAQKAENAKKSQQEATDSANKTFADFIAEIGKTVSASDASSDDTSNGIIFEGSVFKVFKGGASFYYMFKNGKLEGPDDDYGFYANDEYLKITHREMDLIPEDTVCYLAPGSNIPDDLLEKVARGMLDDPITDYRNPVSESAPNNPLPDEAIFVVKLNGKTFYFMCMDDDIKDQSRDYKKLIKSDEYSLEENYDPYPVKLYLKNAK